MATAVLLTVQEVAERLRVTPAAVRNWRLTRKGPPSFKICGRVVFREDQLEAWLDAQSAAGDAA